MGEATKFQWFVDDGGYRWADGTEINKQYRATAEVARSRGIGPVDGYGEYGLGRFIISRRKTGQLYRTYDPMTLNPVMFREFSDLSPTEDDFLAFANRFGKIMYRSDIHEWEDSIDEDEDIIGEDFEMWIAHHSDMKDAVDLWSMAENEDVDGLRKRVKWHRETDQDGRVISNYLTCDNFYSGRPLNPFDIDPGGYDGPLLQQQFEHIISICQPGDVVLPAKLFCLEHINVGLDQNAQQKLIFDPETNQVVKSFMPHNLIGAMWLQFANYVSSDKKNVQCEYCGSWFEPKRKTKKYCSDTCRARASQQRTSNGHSAASEKD